VNGFVNYTFGYKCAFRLLVTLHSLRKHSDLPVTVFFQEGDNACKLLEPFIKEKFDGVTIVWKKLPKTPNVREPFKVECLKSSPYDNTFLIDSDLLFNGPVDDMFDALSEPNYIAVSPFSNWTINHKKCKKHLVQLKNKVYPTELVESFLNQNHPYYNIGIFGVRKCEESTDFLDTWREDMLDIIDNFMCGEMTYNFLQWKHKRQPLDEKYNRSFNLGLLPLEESSIIHYHGNGHRKQRFDSVKLYWNYVKDMIRGDSDYMIWLETDKFLGELSIIIKETL
jgi:hypothetical protein